MWQHPTFVQVSQCQSFWNDLESDNHQKDFKTIRAFKEKVVCLFRINFLHPHNIEYNVLYCGLGICIKRTGQAICAMSNMHCSSKERMCSQIFKLVGQIHINIYEVAHEVARKFCSKNNCLSLLIFGKVPKSGQILQLKEALQQCNSFRDILLVCRIGKLPCRLHIHVW